jgi:hypothetical protein
MLRGPVRIEGAARNWQGRCNPQRMGFPPVTAMVAPGIATILLPTSRRIGRCTDQSRRALRDIIVDRLEATRNDDEVFALDKTVEPQFVEQRLNSASPDEFAPYAAAFRQGLKEAGYVEGRTPRSSIAGQKANMTDCECWQPIWLNVE